MRIRVRHAMAAPAKADKNPKRGRHKLYVSGERVVRPSNVQGRRQLTQQAACCNVHRHVTHAALGADGGDRVNVFDLAL